jgi:uroporphyrinogen-III synthase
VTALFVFRPEPGWTITAETARAMGLEVKGAPLFAIEPVAWDAPDPDDFDGLLIGSANVIRHGGTSLEAFRGLPVHAVGDATAEAAEANGFRIGQTGRGGLQPLLDSFAGSKLQLLRLAGEERVPLAAPEGVHIETRVVYRAVPQALSSEDVQALAAGGVVVLHSAAAARHFARECDRLAVLREAIDLVLIGARLVEGAGKGWHSIHIAEVPDDSHMLAMAKALCQTPLIGKGSTA